LLATRLEDHTERFSDSTWPICFHVVSVGSICRHYWKRKFTRVCLSSTLFMSLGADHSWIPPFTTGLEPLLRMYIRPTAFFSRSAQRSNLPLLHYESIYIYLSISIYLYKQRSVFEARDKKRRQEARTNVKVVPLNWIVRCCGVGVVEQRIRSGELERFRVLGVSWVRLSHSTTFALSNLLDLQYFMCAARNHVKLMTMGPVPCLCLANLLFPRVEDGVRGVRGTKTAATRYLKRGFRRSRGSTTCENLVGGVSAGPSRCRAKREGSWRDARGP
jgi:hypothetical protein